MSRLIHAAHHDFACGVSRWAASFPNHSTIHTGETMPSSAVPFSLATGTPLLGEVFAWPCPGVAARHAALVEALATAGLDPAVARELAPRHAFTRACRKLSDQRIIRPVSEDERRIRFQFTA